MSYYYYVACSRELNTGDYFMPPKSVYPSYAAYMDSEDFQIFESKRTGIGQYKANHELSFDPRIVHGTVHVFESLRDSRCVSIYPFPSPSKRSEEENFIAGQFTLPYLYEISEFPEDLLCKYLQADDQLEFLCIFLSHDNPPDAPVINTLNLQDYVDGKLDFCNIREVISTPPANNLTRILPPSQPQTQFRIEPVDFLKVICTIYLSNADVFWNQKELRKQGLL